MRWPNPKGFAFSIEDPFEDDHDLGMPLSEAGQTLVSAELARALNILEAGESFEKIVEVANADDVADILRRDSRFAKQSKGKRSKKANDGKKKAKKANDGKKNTKKGKKKKQKDEKKNEANQKGTPVIEKPKDIQKKKDKKKRKKDKQKNAQAVAANAKATTTTMKE